ncbi:hypothetical protein EDB92DRAFT_317530 [Lactarius akahatsu]|uniref:Uncharacterized protein n=1 Tax=Lactarius akahatsu TaxID=416441 RepID=A0AAD4QF56_9AGAM|nr:hypothetical protein EDB92DRAFT_317530 [Lactarius akahatsu]
MRLRITVSRTLLRGGRCWLVKSCNVDTPRLYALILPRHIDLLLSRSIHCCNDVCPRPKSALADIWGFNSDMCIVIDADETLDRSLASGDHGITVGGVGAETEGTYCNGIRSKGPRAGTGALLDIVSHWKLGVIRGPFFCSEAPEHHQRECDLVSGLLGYMLNRPSESKLRFRFKRSFCWKPLGLLSCHFDLRGDLMVPLFF